MNPNRGANAMYNACRETCLTSSNTTTKTSCEETRDGCECQVLMQWVRWRKRCVETTYTSYAKAQNDIAGGNIQEVLHVKYFLTRKKKKKKYNQSNHPFFPFLSYIHWVMDHLVQNFIYHNSFSEYLG